jgi:very-short-patch-repair endonuclease
VDNWGDVDLGGRFLSRVVLILTGVDYEPDFDFGDINGPFLGGQAVSEGMLTKEELYSPLFRQLFHNVHIPAFMPVTHELRCRGAVLIAPPGAVLSGCSAAAVRGVDFTTARDPVEFIVPESAKFLSRRGLDIRRTRIPGIDAEPWSDGLLASPLRLAMDILTHNKLRRSFPRVVGILDALLRAKMVDHAALELLVRNRHDHGIRRAREAVALADPRAESIPESELRVLLVRAGFSPVPQVVVYQNGVFLGRLDLAFAEFKLAVEYDGEWHKDSSQAKRDARRRAAFRAAGWTFIIVTKEQLYGDPGAIIAAVRSRICPQVLAA